ncbi:hypothetical protein WR25_13403 [Diploscapter pachys]|uniref:Uncharacterized protein n=1 Tax=Diploscapter pachys TaxID=2018661 RepID=A0A2A2KK07_9BILA|nr:hypothetical protein WR25_13403 [Diploscapter pachys]
MARAEPADAEVRIVGQDRAPGRGPAARDRPGIRAGIGGVQQLVRRRHQLVEFEQPQRRQLRAADLVVDIADAAAPRLHEVAHVPAQRHDAQDTVFERQQRPIALHLRDPRVDAGDIAAHAVEHLARNARQLGVEIAAIMEQPRRRVMRGEVPAEHLGHLPHLAAMCEVDLEQAVARDHIALPEKGIGLGRGADMGNAPQIVDDGDRLRQPRHRRIGGGGGQPCRRPPGCERAECRGAEQEGAARDHGFPLFGRPTIRPRKIGGATVGGAVRDGA